MFPLAQLLSDPPYLLIHSILYYFSLFLLPHSFSFKNKQKYPENKKASKKIKTPQQEKNA